MIIFNNKIILHIFRVLKSFITIKLLVGTCITEEKVTICNVTTVERCSRSTWSWFRRMSGWNQCLLQQLTSVKYALRNPNQVVNYHVLFAKPYFLKGLASIEMLEVCNTHLKNTRLFSSSLFDILKEIAALTDIAFKNDLKKLFITYNIIFWCW